MTHAQENLCQQRLTATLLQPLYPITYKLTVIQRTERRMLVKRTSPCISLLEPYILNDKKGTSPTWQLPLLYLSLHRPNLPCRFLFLPHSPSSLSHQFIHRQFIPSRVSVSSTQFKSQFIILSPVSELPSGDKLHPSHPDMWPRCDVCVVCQTWMSVKRATVAVRRCVWTPKAPDVVTAGRDVCSMRMDSTVEVNPRALIFEGNTPVDVVQR